MCFLAIVMLWVFPLPGRTLVRCVRMPWDRTSPIWLEIFTDRMWKLPREDQPPNPKTTFGGAQSTAWIAPICNIIICFFLTIFLFQERNCFKSWRSKYVSYHICWWGFSEIDSTKSYLICWTCVIIFSLLRRSLGALLVS